MTAQVWFITGNSRGLGRSVAEEALAAGHKVVATARKTNALDDLAERYGDQLLTVADPAQAADALAHAVERFGRIDVVVNNAGYADLAPVEEVSLEAFRAQVEAVFFGTVHVTKAALPVFRRQGSGYLIQVTSVGGRLTAPGLGASRCRPAGSSRNEVPPMQAGVMVAGCPADTGNSGSVRCGLPAEAEGRHTMRSADRPPHRARIRCPRGHWFNGPGFTLAAAMLATGAEPCTAASERTVMQDRTLGRTGIKVSAWPWAR